LCTSIIIRGENDVLQAYWDRKFKFQMKLITILEIND
jgi:hypothetical protein